MKFLKLILPFLMLFLAGNQQALAQIGWTKSYDSATVVTAEKHASEIGNQILKEGGNAIDAAVAVQFTLAVTLPRAGNIGGGGFMVLHLEDGTRKTLDFREMAPQDSDRKMYFEEGEYDSQLSREGALASGVPGVVDGMIRALENYGRLPLQTVLQPAIDLARNGYELSWTQANDLNNHADTFDKFESSRNYFMKESGEPFKEGDLFVQKDLAETLQRIADDGRKGFYTSKTAEMIVEEMQKNDGIINHKDLREYESVWRDPVVANFQDYELAIMPPPSSGSVAIAQILNMLNDHDLKSLELNSAEYIHLITEAMRRAFADRAHYMGDPDFVDIPIEELTAESYNEERMSSFNPDQATSSNDIEHGEVQGFDESPETTHYSIIDNDGNAVAVTTTLNGSFGSHLSVGGAGFLLNNEMDDFTTAPGEPNMFGLIQGEANAIEPGKRMLSSMSPAIASKDGKARMVLGAAGGPRIITATFMNFLNLAVFDMEAQQAIAAPRFHHQWRPDTLYHEPYGISPDTKDLLEEKGHTLVERPTVGRGHIIFVDEDGKLQGAADPRGDGHVSGH